MPTLLTVLASTALINAALGLFVYLTKPGRIQNRNFFLLTLNCSLWAIAIGCVIATQEGWIASSFIRLASYIAALVPISFLLLCMSIGDDSESFAGLAKKVRIPIILSQIVGLMCFTKLYLLGVELVPTETSQVSFPSRTSHVLNECPC